MGKKKGEKSHIYSAFLGARQVLVTFASLRASEGGLACVCPPLSPTARHKARRTRGPSHMLPESAILTTGLWHGN